MKIKEGFVIRELAGQTVVIALGEASKIFNGMIKLNASGRTIWESLTLGMDRDAIVDKLLETYEIDRETASRDCDAFIQILKENGLLEQ